MRQKTFFDNAPKARQDDPDTSHMAAAKAESVLTFAQELMLRVISESLNPVTSAEAAAECVRRDGRVIAGTYRRRTHELQNAGEIKIAGRKLCEVRGTVCNCFRSI